MLSPRTSTRCAPASSVAGRGGLERSAGRVCSAADKTNRAVVNKNASRFRINRDIDARVQGYSTQRKRLWEVLRRAPRRLGFRRLIVPGVAVEESEGYDDKYQCWHGRGSFEPGLSDLAGNCGFG